MCCCCRMFEMTRKNDFIVWLRLSGAQERMYREFVRHLSVEQVSSLAATSMVTLSWNTALLSDRLAAGQYPSRTSGDSAINRQALQVIMVRPCLTPWYAAIDHTTGLKNILPHVRGGLHVFDWLIDLLIFYSILALVTVCYLIIVKHADLTLQITVIHCGGLV